MSAGQVWQLQALTTMWHEQELCGRGMIWCGMPRATATIACSWAPMAKTSCACLTLKVSLLVSDRVL